MHVDIAAVGRIPRRRRSYAAQTPRRRLAESSQGAFRRASAGSALFSRFFVGESEIYVLQACVETTRVGFSAPEDKTKQ
jgi:hypothetical protein